MTEKLTNCLKNRDLIIPYELFNSYKKLGLTDQEFIFIIYILNNYNNFNPKEISDHLSIELNECLKIIDSLSEKDIINIKTIKRNNIMEEIIELDNLYKKLALIIINEEGKQDNNDKKTNIYSEFEKEFGRTLSPIEYELIGSWGEVNSEEIIELALKEAVYNGVTNLRYIDKILHEWNRKGFKTKEDIQKDKASFSSKKIEKKELFDYDWLNEE